jgi:ABC-type thiamin/hydroxymethylpyrimidine transport system permease subunit
MLGFALKYCTKIIFNMLSPLALANHSVIQQLAYPVWIIKAPLRKLYIRQLVADAWKNSKLAFSNYDLKERKVRS